MSGTPVSLAKEAAKAGGYPKKFNKREDKICESVKAYVDTAIAGVPATSVPTLASALLGASATFKVLAGSTVTNTNATAVTGEVGVSPGTSITGFPPGTVTGALHSNDAAAIAAEAALVSAKVVLTAYPSTVLTGDLGGRTLTPGVYSYSSSAALTGTLTLHAGGDPNARFIFQTGTTLTTASSSAVVLAGGATIDNVFWYVGTSATLGSSSTFVGTIVADTAITANTSAAVHGRLWARTAAVTLDTNTVTPT
jgi:hypothetical protein